jgi:hypothetical protein
MGVFVFLWIQVQRWNFEKQNLVITYWWWKSFEARDLQVMDIFSFPCSKLIMYLVSKAIFHTFNPIYLLQVFLPFFFTKKAIRNLPPLFRIWCEPSRTFNTQFFNSFAFLKKILLAFWLFIFITLGSWALCKCWPFSYKDQNFFLDLYMEVQDDLVFRFHHPFVMNYISIYYQILDMINNIFQNALYN